MTSKLIQFQNGLKGLKKRNLNTKGKNDKEKAKKVKHLTHINLKGITKGTPESDIHIFLSNSIKFICEQYLFLHYYFFSYLLLKLLKLLLLIFLSSLYKLYISNKSITNFREHSADHQARSRRSTISAWRKPKSQASRACFSATKNQRNLMFAFHLLSAYSSCCKSSQ